MGIPKQVLDGDAEATRMIEEAGKPEAAAAPENAAPPAAAPAAAPDGNTPAPAAAPDGSATQPPAAPAADLEARFAQLDQAHKVLQGKYAAEVPRLSRRVRELEGENEQLRTRTAPPPAPAAQMTPEELLATIPEADRNEFGERLMLTMARVSRANAHEAATAAVQPVAESVQQSNRERFYSQLTARVPDWRTLNADQDGFLTWLGETDELSGRTYQDMLNTAYSAGDVEKCAKFFDKYKGTHSQPPAPPPAPPPARPSLNEQVVPRPAGGPPASQKRTYRQSEVDTIVTNITKKRYSTAEATRLEKEIDDAYSEGRVTPD
jgi:hypothetical protein